jgi:hypothetical protein
VKTTPKPRATKNSSGELVPPLFEPLLLALFEPVLPVPPVAEAFGSNVVVRLGSPVGVGENEEAKDDGDVAADDAGDDDRVGANEDDDDGSTCCRAWLMAALAMICVTSTRTSFMAGILGEATTTMEAGGGGDGRSR